VAEQSAFDVQVPKDCASHIAWMFSKEKKNEIVVMTWKKDIIAIFVAFVY